MHVVATAGHVDHGKSTLVQSLTGTDPDRWAEEKERGLTIDLGFAPATLPSGRTLSFVDVPGHIRFIRNMLAGVGAVDACLFVVAATEGWKPQSEEHLRILELLGVRHGVVALTKVDIVDIEHRELARLDVADRVAGSFLAGAPIVDVAPPTRLGLDQLRTALDDLLAVTPTAADHARPRLWVDRSFAARGAGTIVTGTLTGGGLQTDDALVLAPAGLAVRVRGLQRHNHRIESVPPGNRVAVNLVGASHDQVGRGDALVRPGQWHSTRRLDASLEVLASLDHEVSRRGAYAAYLGSGEHPVQVRLLGAASLRPGGRGLVRLHLRVALPILPGDRYVLREWGRGETVGGGEVLDVDPVLPAGRAAPSRSVDRVIAERGWIQADDLERRTGERREPQVGRWVVDPAALAAVEGRVTDLVAAAGSLGLDIAGLDDLERAVLDRLARAGSVVVEGGRARPSGAGDAGDALARHPYVAALEASPFAPPPPEGVDPGEQRELVRRGLVVERDGMRFAPSAVDAAAREVARMLDAKPDGLTVSEVRERLGTTRKFVMPLLAELDARGVTRRRGDRRIAGPRLPPP